MGLKEVQEQLRAIACVRNNEVMITSGTEDELNELVYHIVTALLTGYSLCNLNVALAKMEEHEKRLRRHEDYYVASHIRQDIEMVREACE